MNPLPVKGEHRPPVSFLNAPGGGRLAYRLSDGATPGVVFLSGFRSDMNGSKALAAEAFCRARGRRFLCFDYGAHGQSSGDFMQSTVGSWKEDALAMLDHVATGENILIGSSMGGWLMLLAALARPERVRGLIGIASAPDFTETLVWEQFSAAQKRQLEGEGAVYIPDCYGGEPYPFTKRLIEEGRGHLLLNGAIPLSMPVRLLHGMDDADVPWHVSATLLQRLQSPDATLTLIKDGDHRLSKPGDLRALERAIGEILSF